MHENHCYLSVMLTSHYDLYSFQIHVLLINAVVPIVDSREPGSSGFEDYEGIIHVKYVMSLRTTQLRVLQCCASDKKGNRDNLEIISHFSP